MVTIVRADILVIYLMTLPFWILALANSLYNQRFRRCLNLPEKSDR